jgi:tricorn protease
VDVGGTNFERTSMGLTWSPDSKWLAYAKTFPNNFRRIVTWSVDSGEAHPLTDPMADAFSPSWDRDGRHMYFLASTDLALGSGWANTSSMVADPTYGAYVMVLRADDPTPFPPKATKRRCGRRRRNPRRVRRPKGPSQKRMPMSGSTWTGSSGGCSPSPCR